MKRVNKNDIGYKNTRKFAINIIANECIRQSADMNILLDLFNNNIGIYNVRELEEKIYIQALNEVKKYLMLKPSTKAEYHVVEEMEKCFEVDDDEIIDIVSQSILTDIIKLII